MKFLNQMEMIRWAALAAASACLGCQAPQNSAVQGEPIQPIFGGSHGENQKRPDPIAVEKVDTHDDIIAINDIWQNYPWRGNQEGQVVGFTTAVYFQSGTTGKGSFVPGTIRCRLSSVQRKAGGTERLTLQTWEFDEKAAMGFRVMRKTINWYFYGFPLVWSPDLKLTDKEIEIQFEYERKDGRIVTGSPKRLKVPRTGDQALVEHTQVK